MWYKQPMEQQTLYSFLDKLAEKHPNTKIVVTMVTQNGDSGRQFMPNEELILVKVDEEDDNGGSSEFWAAALCWGTSYEDYYVIKDQDLVIDSNSRIMAKMPEFSGDVYLTLFKKELVQIRI